MGKQPSDKERLGRSALSANLVGQRVKNETGQKGSHFWNRLPQWLNLLRYQLQGSPQAGLLDYEPMFLHIMPSEMQPQSGQTSLYRPLTLDSFRFLLDQCPAVPYLVFAGLQHDPFENPDLLGMVQTAFRFNGAESTIVTPGGRLKDVTDAILRSPLQTLVIRMAGHRPSSFALFTGAPPSNFVPLEQQVWMLAQARQQRQSNLRLTLSFVVDIHNYREIPAMITYAQSLGATGVALENYQGRDGFQHTDRTIYTHHRSILAYMQELAKTVPEGFEVTWPVALDVDMSNHRHCNDPFSAVSVDSNLTLCGCSRFQFCEPESGKIWDEDFFNNAVFQKLRQIHKPLGSNHASAPVPSVCQTCPNNMPNRKR